MATGIPLISSSLSTSGTESEEISYSSPVPARITTKYDTIVSVEKKDCCDHIVPPERQPNCCQNLSSRQKTIICCGTGAVIVGGTVGTLIGTGTLSISQGGGTILLIIGICCAIKLGLVCLIAKSSSQDS